MINEKDKIHDIKTQSSLHENNTEIGLIEQKVFNTTDTVKSDDENGIKLQEAVTEINGPRGLEPTRYGDWESKGRCVDF